MDRKNPSQRWVTTPASSSGCGLLGYSSGRCLGINWGFSSPFGKSHIVKPKDKAHRVGGRLLKIAFFFFFYFHFFFLAQFPGCIVEITLECDVAIGQMGAAESQRSSSTRLCGRKGKGWHEGELVNYLAKKKKKALSLSLSPQLSMGIVSLRVLWHMKDANSVEKK